MNKKLNILIHGGGSSTNNIINQLNKTKYPFNLYISSPVISPMIKCKEILNPKTTKFSELKDFIKRNNIDLVIIFDSRYCCFGLVDIYKKNFNIPVIGVNKQWYQLESSKTIGKEFMIKNKINTPEFIIINSLNELKNAINHLGYPIVLKNNYLKAGFGSYICNSENEAYEICADILIDCGICIAEKFIKGDEITQHYIWDENHLTALNPVKDYKKSKEGNTGINTGGMGSYTPVDLTKGQKKSLEKYNKYLGKIFKKLHPDFTGIFAADLLFKGDEIYTLEFNMRPCTTEFEVLSENMDVDLLELLYNIANKKADKTQIKYKNEKTGCVVLTHDEYVNQTIKEININIQEFIENKPPDININLNIIEMDEKFNAKFLTGAKIASIISSDKLNPFDKIYKFINSIDNKKFYYRKDIGT